MIVDSTNVHPDLQQQYQRYKILAAALVVSSILPPVTLFIFYSTSSGLVHLGTHMLSVVVALLLEIPLMLGLANLIAIKRMRFLERSSQLVKGGVRQDLHLIGAYKLKTNDGGNTCILDLGVGDRVERFPVIPSKSIEAYVQALPELPETPALENRPKQTEKVYGYVDQETKAPVAVEIGGNIFWITPPTKLF